MVKGMISTPLDKYEGDVYELADRRPGTGDRLGLLEWVIFPGKTQVAFVDLLGNEFLT